MARWTVDGITSVPRVSNGGSDDPAWYPLQHALGIDTFGVNLFVRRSARALTAGTTLLVVGASNEPFKSTWNPGHFSDIRRPA